MESGSYWEYFCPFCGYNFYRRINDDGKNDKTIKKLVFEMGDKHDKECKFRGKEKVKKSSK